MIKRKTEKEVEEHDMKNMRVSEGDVGDRVK